jgi:hypothetical protein
MNVYILSLKVYKNKCKSKELNKKMIKCNKASLKKWKDRNN